MADVLADDFGRVAVRFTPETLVAFMEALAASDIRHPDRPDQKLTFHTLQFEPGEAELVCTTSTVEPRA